MGKKMAPLKCQSSHKTLALSFRQNCTAHLVSRTNHDHFCFRFFFFFFLSCLESFPSSKSFLSSPTLFIKLSFHPNPGMIPNSCILVFLSDHLFTQLLISR